MSQTQIEALLQQKIGLNATSLGPQAIARWVRQRMVVCDCDDLAEYLLQLQTNAAELKALIEAVVVPETWFFRDREPFVFLGRYVQSEWLVNRPNRKLRVLSLPCSTGEEPYSIAIALLEAGLVPHQFHIDAIDISQKALAKAERAIYDPYSFRGHQSVVLQRQPGTPPSHLSIQDLYFRSVDGRYQLLDSIKRLVSFYQGNVLDPDFLIGKPCYDIVFCRNLLIYLDQSARQKVFQVFDQLLRPEGLLFTGHSEISQLPPAQFSLLKPVAAFVARKQPSISAPLEKKPSDRLSKPSPTSPFQPIPQPLTTHLLPTPETTSQPLAASPIKTAEPGLSQNLEPIPSLLAAAREQANQGNLDSAIELCEAHLAQHSTDADAYVLLGEVQQATGQEHQAEQCFQKALYLQPRHEEALMHLVLLKEQRGDVAGAAIARQRLERLRKV